MCGHCLDPQSNKPTIKKRVVNNQRYLNTEYLLVFSQIIVIFKFDDHIMIMLLQNNPFILKMSTENV